MLSFASETKKKIYQIKEQVSKFWDWIKTRSSFSVIISFSSLLISFAALFFSVLSHYTPYYEAQERVEFHRSQLEFLSKSLNTKCTNLQSKKKLYRDIFCETARENLKREATEFRKILFLERHNLVPNEYAKFYFNILSAETEIARVNLIISMAERSDNGLYKRFRRDRSYN